MKMRLADFDLLPDEEREAIWDSVHAEANAGVGRKQMLEDCINSEVNLKMRWGKAIDPRYDTPLSTHRLELMTAKLRTERSDVVAFIEHPPGRVPDGARLCVAELARAIRGGAHAGWAKGRPVALALVWVDQRFGCCGAGDHKADSFDPASEEPCPVCGGRLDGKCGWACPVESMTTEHKSGTITADEVPR